MSNRAPGLPSPRVDPRHLISTFGTVGVFAIIFAETGLLVGFFLPGDSLLFTAGLLSAPSVHKPVHLNLAVVLPGVFVAAVVGAQVGYLIGRRAGPAVFRRPESRLFKREYVDRARAFFDDHGARTIVLARFIPVVRTFANVMPPDASSLTFGAVSLRRLTASVSIGASMLSRRMMSGPADRASLNCFNVSTSISTDV